MSNNKQVMQQCCEHSKEYSLSETAWNTQFNKLALEEPNCALKRGRIYKFILICVIIYLLSNDLCLAQFTPAVITNQTSGSTLQPYSIGNDILDDGASVYRVSSYTDGGGLVRPGITWAVYDGFTTWYGSADMSLGSISGATDAYCTDIVLIKDNVSGAGYVHAITVWTVVVSGGQECIIEDFYWDASASPNPTFTTNTQTFIANGIIPSTINIDGDDNGNFVIVYNDVTNNKIFAVTGNIAACMGCSSGTLVSLNNSGTPVPLQNGTSPDVCLYNNGTTEYVHVGYIDVNGKLAVDGYDFTGTGSLSSPPATRAIELAPVMPILGYSFPRIACPTGAGASTDWTVVVQDADRSTSYIEGFNQYKSSASARILYNNAASGSPYPVSTPTPSTRTVWNYLPVVAYDKYANVFVGWNMDNSGGTISGAVTAAFPVVVACDGQAYPTYYAPNTSTSYFEVPYGLTGADNSYFLALASRYSTALFQTFYDYNASNVKYKWVNSGATTSLRLADKVEEHLGSIEQQLNMVSTQTPLIATIYDNTGKLIAKQFGDKVAITSLFKNNFGQFAPGIYITTIISEDGSIRISDKFIAGK
jgi:hypothetical protein